MDDSSNLGPAGGISRRSFIKWTAAAGILGAFSGTGALSAVGYLKGPQEPIPEWEVAPGVVDYSRVEAEKLTGPTPNILKVAQWYDYWPGSFLDDFTDYMKSTYNMTVDVEWDVFTSNEELFQLITLGRHRYDVMVPTNYYADLYKRAGMIYEMNDTWLPNVKENIDWDLVQRPKDDPWNRKGPNGPMIGVPYFWGTTGIGYRTDKIRPEDMEEIGYDIFHMDTYTAQGTATLDLRKKMRMLDELNDVFTAGFKEAGWDWQGKQGYPPSGLLQEFGGNQWTSSETDPARVRACGEWLFAAKPRLFDFNSTEAYTALLAGTAYADQDWNGDIVYAARPDQNTPQPVDYVVPKQGSTIWYDCIAIHNKCRNLWLAHEFIDFVHRVDPPWEENQLLTRWNLYSTPNKKCFEDLHDKPFPNGYDMTKDVRAYPNVNDPDVLKRCDISRYNNIDVLLNEYNPLWTSLTGD